MMLPTLISVSVAPVSYFFWARALLLMARVAMSAVENAALLVVGRESIIIPWFGFLGSGLRLVLPEFADQALGDHADLPCAVRHQEDHKEQQDAEHGAGKALGNSLGDIQHEDDDDTSDDRARPPAAA